MHFFHNNRAIQTGIANTGFNVYPNEVENVVTTHPGVLEAAAVGVPSAKSGEAVKLFVVRKDPALDARSLIAYCRERLTGYKTPDIVEFVDALPKSNVGKVLRRELKSGSLSGTRTVGGNGNDSDNGNGNESDNDNDNDNETEG